MGAVRQRWLMLTKEALRFPNLHSQCLANGLRTEGTLLGKGRVEAAVFPGLTSSSTATSETTCSRQHNLKMTRGLDPQVTAWRKSRAAGGPPDPH